MLTILTLRMRKPKLFTRKTTSTSTKSNLPRLGAQSTVRSLRKEKFFPNRTFKKTTNMAMRKRTSLNSLRTHPAPVRGVDPRTKRTKGPRLQTKSKLSLWRGIWFQIHTRFPFKTTLKLSQISCTMPGPLTPFRSPKIVWYRPHRTKCSLSLTQTIKYCKLSPTCSSIRASTTTTSQLSTRK